jgi:hypothetical protein
MSATTLLKYNMMWDSCVDTMYLFDGVFITLLIVMSPTFLYHDYKEIYSYFVSILYLPIIFTCITLPALKPVVEKLITAKLIALFMLCVLLHAFIKACLSIKLFYQTLTLVIDWPLSCMSIVLVEGKH